MVIDFHTHAFPEKVAQRAIPDLQAKICLQPQTDGTLQNLAEKKERLISSEVDSNNELINLNLQSYLIPRQQACKEFNDKFGLTGTDKEISVRVRSDLYKFVKQFDSIASDYSEAINAENNLEDKLKGEQNG